jgi:hypothetical protein
MKPGSKGEAAAAKFQNWSDIPGGVPLKLITVFGSQQEAERIPNLDPLEDLSYSSEGSYKRRSINI